MTWDFLTIFIIVISVFFIFLLQALAFFWGAKAVGIDRAHFSTSLAIALLSTIIGVIIFALTSKTVIIPILAEFIVPTLLVKSMYNTHIEKAFWSSFIAIIMMLIVQAVLIVIRQNF